MHVRSTTYGEPAALLAEHLRGSVISPEHPDHARLARIKAAYDPDNRFRLNQNIRPAGP